MRFSIRWRLFLAVAALSLLVAVIALALTRWQLVSDFGAYTTRMEMDSLADLRRALAAHYRRAGSWAFLPAHQDRQAWLHSELQRLANERIKGIEALPELPPAPPLPETAPTPPVPPDGVIKQASPHAGLVGMATPPPPPQAPLPVWIGDVPAGLVARISVRDADDQLLIGTPTSETSRLQVPLVVDGALAGSFAITRATQPEGGAENEFLINQMSSLAFALLLSVLLSAIAAALLADHFRRPIQALVAGTRDLRAGRFDTRVTMQRSDELGELADSFNQLAGKLDDIERARQQWISDTSHELRTPLTVMRAQLEAMQDGVRPASMENIALLLRQLQGMSQLVDDLFALAQAEEGLTHMQRTRVDLTALLRDTLASFHDRLHNAGLQLQLQLPEHTLCVAGDNARLQQVLRNLLENSVRYTAAGGSLQVTLARVGEHALLSVEDSAPGVPDAALAQLGERFFRVDASRSRASGGAGLGLSLCKKIIEAHGGSLQFSHAALGGLCIDIRLPSAGDTP